MQNLLPSGLERRFQESGEDVTRIALCSGEDTTESSAILTAGADGGRAGTVFALSVTSPGVTGQAVSAPGPATHAVIQASVVGATGPWTNVTAGTLAAPAAVDVALQVWVRILVLRGFSRTNPRHCWQLRLVARSPAAWGR